MARRRRRHLICPIAKDGYHAWESPEAKHGLGAMFAECRICGAVLWTPRQVIVSDPQRGTFHPHATKASPQHITGYVAAPPNEHDDSGSRYYHAPDDSGHPHT